MYLPDLGIDCRKTISKYPEIPRALTPFSQVVLIYALIKGSSKSFTPSELADKLGYPRMTMSRALDILEALGLGKSSRKGKERLFYFQEKQSLLWKQALPFMQTPIRETLWIQVDERTQDIIKGLGYLAGLSALALQSPLIYISCPIFAIHHVQWKVLLEKNFIKILPIAEGAQVQVEVWNYDPGLFAKNGVVDDFSLYLSLKDQKDERIEKALENLMENKKW
jgi:DNA-binding MarR family transcriptional regulator